MQQKPSQELTLSEKMKLVQYLAFFPALTLMVFIRRKIGFRILKPADLIGIWLALTLIENLCESFWHPLGTLFAQFTWLFLLCGLLQRYRRWRELCRGERWHTMSPGISYLELLPLPKFLLTQRRIYRFAEPSLCFIAAMLIGIFFSEPVARWIAFSSICLFLYEQALYEKQLDRDLDLLDGLIAAEVHSETVDYFSGQQPDGKQRSLQETAGIPTGVAFDIHKQIEKLRARQSAGEEREKAEALVRQVQQVKMAAGVMPKDVTPTTAELPPPDKKPKIAPDNLAPEPPENPAP